MHRIDVFGGAMDALLAAEARCRGGVASSLCCRIAHESQRSLRCGVVTQEGSK